MKQFGKVQPRDRTREAAKLRRAPSRRLSARPICGPTRCTIRGEWHLAWLIPVNGLGNGFIDNRWLGYGRPGYAFAGFLMPFLYGSWRFMLFSYVAGPFAAGLTTSSLNEWPAVWCLFSIALCLTIIKTPLRRWLTIETPYWRALLTGPLSPKAIARPREFADEGG